MAGKTTKNIINDNDNDNEHFNRIVGHLLIVITTQIKNIYNKNQIKPLNTEDRYLVKDNVGRKYLDVPLLDSKEYREDR